MLRIGVLCQLGQQVSPGCYLGVVSGVTTLAFVSAPFICEKDSLLLKTGNDTRRRQWHPTPVLVPGKSHGRRSLEGCSPWGREESDTTEWLHFHALEKEMATHSSVLAWRIPGTGEPGGLPSMGSHRVGHDWSDLAAAGNDTSGGKTQAWSW